MDYFVMLAKCFNTNFVILVAFIDFVPICKRVSKQSMVTTSFKTKKNDKIHKSGITRLAEKHFSAFILGLFHAFKISAKREN